MKITSKEVLFSLRGFIATNWQTILSASGTVGIAGLAAYFAYRTCKDTGTCPQYSDLDRGGLDGFRSFISTGRTEPRDLQEKLAIEEVLSNPLKGAKRAKGIIMNDPRFRAKDGWVKMQRETLNYPKDFRNNHPEAHEKIIFILIIMKLLVK